MTSRETILAGLKKAQYTGDPLPDLTGFGVRYDDLVAQYDQSLQAVGGKLLRVANESKLASAIAELDIAQKTSRVYSDVEAAAESNVDLAGIDDPRELNQLDLAVVAGEFAVAENGAVWVDPSQLRHRAVLFIAEHLVLVVKQSDLVHNMHQAYERLGTDLPRYGLFISGPSKTADIEQSLVIGAQGPRSLHVCLLAE